ncbi:hypothetical protein Pcinc_043818 [Petrolisthes cinctipes]|uniref:Uncharacterized protein n=1 Tax=Petrolisthes cinctipes TaxID=88211 RepID=A0AAE1BEX1_PETCI|nr:hypothetical protein Pcinc_043818 [Petrolisthes cinctipes]
MSIPLLPPQPFYSSRPSPHSTSTTPGPLPPTLNLSHSPSSTIIPHLHSPSICTIQFHPTSPPTPPPLNSPTPTLPFTSSTPPTIDSLPPFPSLSHPPLHNSTPPLPCSTRTPQYNPPFLLLHK